MNITKKLGLTFGLGIWASFSLISQATELKAADASVDTNLCMIALSGNRAAMYNAIKDSGYSSTFIVKNLRCNGENLLAYVEQHGNNSTAMLRILDRRKVNTSITDIAKN